MKDTKTLKEASYISKFVRQETRKRLFERVVLGKNFEREMAFLKESPEKGLCQYVKVLIIDSEGVPLKKLPEGMITV